MEVPCHSVRCRRRREDTAFALQDYASRGLRTKQGRLGAGGRALAGSGRVEGGRGGAGGVWQGRGGDVQDGYEHQELCRTVCKALKQRTRAVLKGEGN